GVLESPSLVLDPVFTNHAGTYQVIVSNPFGSVTSAPVTLTVEAPLQPMILWQPYGDTVGVGGFYQFSVLAAGTPTLKYQWWKDGVEVAGATAPALSFGSVDYTNAGSYIVRIENGAGVAWSLPARLAVTNAINGGGRVSFSNRFPGRLDAPVLDLDGFTPLNNSNYLVQLYGGLSLELLRPAGEPIRFRSGVVGGYFQGLTVTLPTVPPESNAVIQVRVWDATKGTTYEEARAFGGTFGKSELFTVTAGGGFLPPAILTGLKSFRVQAGLPQFTQGQIFFNRREPRGVLVWSHRGETGFRYLIEKSVHGMEWHPYLVITNTTSTVEFTDTAETGSAQVFYRSRILD
ncbi:MAG TPA: immunoglobulin domain-containing protein, partial [Clostridia bacterium]|nr:immunoglobulin domain-containing protein [Clostridia bacterium]